MKITLAVRRETVDEDHIQKEKGRYKGAVEGVRKERVSHTFASVVHKSL